MPFSFNPSQAAPASPIAQAAFSSPNVAVSGMQAPGSPAASSLPSIPDSPFLFLRNRDKEMTPVSYLQILLIVVAVLSVVASITLFAYSQYLSASIKTKKEEILAKDALVKDYPIAEMQRLSKRFTSLDKIMKEYISVRSPLKMLESVVERQAVFDNFSFSKEKSEVGYLMSFDVLTNNYRVLSQQLDALYLKSYSKIVPQPKIGTPLDNISSIKIRVTAPVFAQGKHPDDPDFNFIDSVGNKVVNSSSTVQ